MRNSPSSENSPNRAGAAPFPDHYIQIEQRVRYSETDQMGVAHNKVYFEWFELGRTEFCRSRGIPYGDIEKRGIYLVVAESFCRYKKPLRYDDLFFIRTAVRTITPKKSVFVYELRTKDGKTLIAEGATVHVAVDKRGAVISLPDDILVKIAAPLAA
jgi:acyl-CoA thioester hydrolase